MIIEHVIVRAPSPPTGIEPLVRTRPKAMLPVVGKPMIARVMDGFYQVGIRRFTVVVGEHEGTVVEWLNTRWHADAKINFALQGHRRGTASTLFATRHLIDGPFIITPCDTLVPEEHIANLCRYFETYKVDATVLSVYNDEQQRIEGVSVLLDPRGQVLYVTEKAAPGHQGNLTALPIYGFTPRVLEYLDRVPVEETGGRPLTTAIQMMIDDGQPVGTVETEWAAYIHTPDDLFEANMYFLSQLSKPSILSEIPASAMITPPVHVDPGVFVGERVKLGPNVYLENGTEVGQDAVLSNSVVLGRQIAGRKRVEGPVVSKDIL